jgi:hypothetical protein
LADARSIAVEKSSQREIKGALGAFTQGIPRCFCTVLALGISRKERGAQALDARYGASLDEDCTRIGMRGTTVAKIEAFEENALGSGFCVQY